MTSPRGSGSSRGKRPSASSARNGGRPYPQAHRSAGKPGSGATSGTSRGRGRGRASDPGGAGRAFGSPDRPRDGSGARRVAGRPADAPGRGGPAGGEHHTGRPGTAGRGRPGDAEARGRPDAGGRGRPRDGESRQPRPGTGGGGRPEDAAGRGRSRDGESRGGRPVTAGREGRPVAGGRGRARDAEGGWGSPSDRRPGTDARRGPAREGHGRGERTERDGGTRPARPQADRDPRGFRLAPARPAGPAADEPAIPSGVDAKRLDPSVRAELRSLAKANADIVAGHLVAAGEALESDPRRALAHARAARRRAGRIGAVREAAGIAAYHAGEWAEALSELRTARRISGDPGHLPVMADCERALGKPEAALRMLTDPGVGRLDPATMAELLIVAAGARRDMGQPDAALALLARGGLDPNRPRPGSARLWYVYADLLADLGRTDEAARWFVASAGADPDGETDAAERAAALL